jgi:inner membrane protein
MEGRSHLLIGLTAGVVLDSVAHITGDPLLAAKGVTIGLLVNKIIYYTMVGFGALLPDIDNAHSTLGHKFGWISKEIQHLAGHRTLFHSLLGLLIGSLMAIGLEQLVAYLLVQRGYIIPAQFITASHLIFIAVLFGCIIHIAADAMTEGGVPLLWPNHKRFGFPPNPHWRFRTGTWPEFVIVWSFMILVGVGIYQSILVV